jgi:hypothetical protein
LISQGYLIAAPFAMPDEEIQVARCKPALRVIKTC